MNFVELLNRMRELGIQLWVEENRLRYSAPHGVWNEELQKELIEHKSEMMDFLRRAESSGGIESQPQIPSAPRDQFLPLSFPQQRIWFFEQLQPGSAVYNVPLTFQLSGVLNVEILQTSLNELAERHESLRTAFVLNADNQPAQVIADRVYIPLEQVSVESFPASQRVQEARRLATEHARQPLNLAQAPLLRALVIRLDENSHVLCFNIHHIISDGWSEGILFRELSLLYRAHLNHTDIHLPPLSIQYADFAHWQNNQFTEAASYRNSLAYWKEKLGGELPLSQLPADHPRPSAQTFRGAVYSFLIPTQMLDALKEFSRRENASLFMTLLAAFDLLLYRCSAQNDLIVGVPVANREHSGVEGIIGFFTNTIALRATISPADTFRGWLSIIRRAALEAYEHQNIPFEKVVESLKPERSLKYSPIFQVMFAFEDARHFELELPGVTSHPWLVDAGISKFDLTLFAAESSNGLECSFEYSADLYEAQTIARMAARFPRLLESILQDADQPVGKLPILPAAELRQLLVEWNDTQVEFPTQCVHDLFAEQAARAPDAIALAFDNRQMTYAELNHRANQLANYLQARGVQADVLVGVCVERSPEMLVALLGILKAGGAYVAIDPAYPEARQRYIIEDSGISILLTQDKLRASLHFFSGEQLLSLDGEWAAIEKESETAPLHTASPETLAYVLYTSGSTGKPKGTMILHRGLSNYLNWCLRAYPSDGQGSPLHSSLAFDLTVTSIFPALLSGRKVLLLPEALGIDALEWAVKKEKDFSLIKITPAHLNMLNQQVNPAEAGEVTRAFIIGGEALYYEQVKLWLENAPHTALINEYGPTETVVGCCVYSIPRNCPPQGAIPIGRPIDNTQLYVLDEFLQPLPIGVAGELYIGGAGVARGYLNQPELTAQKFIPNPFSADPASRLYKTGDRVRWMWDGNLEFLGRLDFQVKIRGYRIELGEIESVLTQHPQVRQAVVVDAEDASGIKRLLAYIVADSPNGQDLLANLRRDLRHTLPDYMIPAAFVLLDEIPLTPNGKVERRALPAPDTTSFSADSEFSPPQTPTEQILAGVWTDLLGVERIGRNDHFFEMGGHSLMAAQMAARLRQTLRAELSVRSVFESPTLSGLSAHIDSLRAAAIQPPPPMPLLDRSFDYPLSFSQQRLWVHHQIEGATAAYNLHIALKLRGSLNISALEFSLNEIVRRHEALRATFPTLNGSPRQRIAREMRVSLRVVDWQSNPKDEKEIQRVLTQEAALPFDLETAPLFRAALYLLNHDESILLLNMHHAVSDGWSWGIFWEEIAYHYQAYLHQTATRLPDLERQYVDFSVWQRIWLEEGAFDTQLTYWKKQLAGAPLLLDLPTDYPRPPEQSFRGGVFAFEVEPRLFSMLKALSRKQGVSLFMLLYAAFATLLFRYSGHDDLVIGTIIANRHYPFVEKMIGYFINNLALRVNLSGQPTFAEVLERVRQMTLDAYANQDAPFDQLVTELNIPRNLSHPPLFQVMISLDNTGIEVPRIAGLDASILNLERHTAKFDLSLEFSETADSLRATLEYSADLFRPETAARMVGHLQTLLAAVAANPAQPITTLPLLTEAERAQMLGEWTQTQREYPSQCFQTLFEQQVERAPDAIAAVFEDESLTYRALNERANQLAHHLRALDIRPEKIVGVCMERSLEMLVSLLAIFKSGGVYVPLDPALPAERLDFIISNSQAEVVLTKSAYEEKLSTSAAHLIRLDTFAKTLEAYPRSNPQNLSTPKNLACVFYTSGSTGVPKGAMVEQQGMVNHLYAKINDLRVTSRDRIAETAPQSFIISIWQFLAALLMGGTTHIFNDEISHDPEKLLNHIQQDSISILEIVPSLMRFVLEEARARGSSKPSLAALRWVLLTGEALPPQPCRDWLTHYPNIPLMNAYGSTECSDDVAHYPIYAPPPAQMTVTPIGKAVTNMRLYILDAHMQPLPIGIPGEMYVGGIGVGRGYLHNPERTAASFTADPFVLEPNARFYKTGDLVRWLPDGNIEFLGRIDHQVKIRGFRIELGEIESVLSRHPAVEESIVLARTESNGTQRLVAYLTVGVETLAAKEQFIPELRGYLKQKLPEYMIPGAFVVLNQFPLNPNGKVDRKSLPEPDVSALFSAAEFAPPQTPAEQTLAEIWMDLLGLEQVGRQDNFFELGGDSIVSLQLVHRAEAKGLKFTPRQVFEAQTIESLARMASRNEALVTQRAEEVEPLDALSQLDLEQLKVLGVDAARVYPLSPLQSVMFSQSLSSPASGLYFTQNVFEIRGDLDSPRFHRAWLQVLERHDTLRSYFIWQGFSEPLQVVGERVALPWQELDLRGDTPLEQEARLARILEEQRSSAVDLSQTPLMRCALARLKDQHYQFILNLHHTLADGWSYSVLLQEVLTLYADPARQLSFAHPYRDYVFWLRRQNLQQAEVFWRDKLAGFNAPTPLPKQHVADFRNTYAEETLSLSEDVSARLQTFAQQNRVTLNTLFQAAWALTLHQYSAEQDILFGVTVSGRSAPLPDIESRVGLFINTLPLRLKLNPAFLLAEWLQTIMKEQILLEQYVYTPQALLQSCSNLPQNQPLFASHLRFQNYPFSEIDLRRNGQLELSTLRVVDWWHYPLNLVIVPNFRVKLTIMYNSSLFEQAVMHDALRDMEFWLSRFLSCNPDEPLGAILSC